MKGLFLDDERFPNEVTWENYPENIEWDIARTVKEFLDLIRTGSYGIISFDHDLQDFDETGNENTGYTAVKQLVIFVMYRGTKIPQKCYFHTKNPIGKENMQSYWENFLGVCE